MLDFMRIGGFNMWFLAILGVIMVGTAIRFAALADPQRLAILRALTFVIITCAIIGFLSGAIRCLLSGFHAPGTVDELPVDRGRARRIVREPRARRRVRRHHVGLDRGRRAAHAAGAALIRPVV